MALAAAPPGARYVCMTLNIGVRAPFVDLDAAQAFWLQLATADPSPLRYLIWSRELGAGGDDNAGQLHFQAYAEFHVPMRWPAVKALFGQNTLHLGARRRSRDEARNYCRKPETHVAGPWELGEWIAGQGARSDVTGFIDCVLTGADDLAIAEAHPGLFCRSLRAIDRLRAAKLKRDTPHLRRVEVYNLWGPTGVGKSYAAMLRGGDDYYRLPYSTSGLWIDGYEGEKVLLIEDFAGGIPFRLLLQLLDGYKTQNATKGGFAWGAWTTVIITSDAPPECWYTKSEHCVNGFPQLLRRFDHGSIRHMSFDELEVIPDPRPVGWRRRVLTVDHVCVPPVWTAPAPAAVHFGYGH